MAKVILEFDSNEEREDMESAINGWKWKMVAWNFDQHMRAIYKYEDNHTQEVYDIIEKLRDEFRKIISEENHKLSVIDLYLDWCGPCEAMQSNYQTIWFNFESPETRLEFWTATQEIIPEEVLALLKQGPISCKPRFVVY